MIERLPLLLAASFALESPALAQIVSLCGSAILAPSLEIERWATSRKTFVDHDFQREISGHYCLGARQLLAESSDPLSPGSVRVSADTLNRIRAEVIDDYLDNYSDMSRAARTMRAVLRSHLGVQGFSRPVARSRGVVHVTYRGVVDRLRLRGQVFDPWPKFLLLPGPATFVGLRGGNSVCRGTVTVNIAAPVAITC